MPEKFEKKKFVLNCGPLLKGSLGNNAQVVSTVPRSGVASTLQKCGALPTVLFGFSFGAILAYETACALSAMASPGALHRPTIGTG